MGKFTDQAEDSLDKKGFEPARPTILFLMGKIVNDVYDSFYEKKSGLTVGECTRLALDKTLKHLSVTMMDEWRAMYDEDGYVMMTSPVLGRFYVCRDEEAHEKIKNNGLVIYMEDELGKLKGATNEDLLVVHEAKRCFKGRVVR